MSIDGFVEEISSLNKRRQEDEQWRKVLDNHRDMIECFIIANSGLIKYANRIIELAEEEFPRLGLTQHARMRFTDMSENCKAWELSVELIRSFALRYENRINQMITSNLNDSDTEIEELKRRMESMRTVASRLPMMESFVEASINLVIALYQIMEIIERENRDAGLTSRVNRRLGEMADDVEHVKRTLNLIPRVLPGLLARVQRMNNQRRN